MPNFRLYFVTDRAQTANRPLTDIVHAALDGGVRAVQLREKDLAGRDLYALAEQLRTLTLRYRAHLLVNDRLDVALAVDADGVHLGQRSFAVRDARRLLGAGKIIGVSTHSRQEIVAAREADFLVFGPVYYTPQRPSMASRRGLTIYARQLPVARCRSLRLAGSRPRVCLKSWRLALTGSP